MEYTQNQIKEIGMAQRVILLGVLADILCTVICMVIPALVFLAPVVNIVVAVCLILNVYKLSMVFGYSTGVTVILCVLLFLPLIGLIELLWLVVKASGILKAAGLPVGLLGVSKAELDKL